MVIEPTETDEVTKDAIRQKHALISTQMNAIVHETAVDEQFRSFA